MCQNTTLGAQSVSLESPVLECIVAARVAFASLIASRRCVAPPTVLNITSLTHLSLISQPTSHSYLSLTSLSTYDHGYQTCLTHLLSPCHPISHHLSLHLSPLSLPAHSHLPYTLHLVILEATSNDTEEMTIGADVARYVSVRVFCR